MTNEIPISVVRLTDYPDGSLRVVFKGEINSGDTISYQDKQFNRCSGIVTEVVEKHTERGQFADESNRGISYRLKIL